MSRKIEVRITADTSRLRKGLLRAEHSVAHPGKRFYPRIATEYEWWMEKVSRIFNKDKV
jgi:hypothetical protein